MYLREFIERMGRKSNVPVLIYLALNIFVITITVDLTIESYTYCPVWKAFVLSIMLYAASLAIALSPAGEWFLRMQSGCREIKRTEQKNFIEPIFQEVYDKAKKMDSTIPDDVHLFINDDESPNAFATGRKTICITRGLLDMPEEQIKAVLAHEFGHLAHKDTDLLLVVTVGNLIVNAIIIGFRIFAEIMHFVLAIAAGTIEGRDGIVTHVIARMYRFLSIAAIAGAAKLWTWIGTSLVMKSCRENEFEADEFAYNLGYGNELCTLLDSITGMKAEGLFAALAKSHPDKDERIARLQELGASYKAAYYA